MRHSGNVQFENGYGPRVAAIIHKFGMNDAVVATGSGSTIWGAAAPPTAIYQWPTVAGVASFASAAGAADAGVQFVAEGLDDDHLFQTEDVTLDAAGLFTSTTKWWAGWRLALAADSPAALTGALTMTVDSKVVALASVLAQQTQQCIYQIPANQTGFLKKVNLDPARNDDSEGHVFTQDFGAPAFRLRDNLHLFTTNPGRHYGVDGSWSDGIQLPPKTRVELRAIAATGTDKITGHFLIGLFDN